MGPVTAFFSFLVIWWIALFAVLPFGVKTQEENNDVVPGSERGAPTHVDFKSKIIATTLVAVVVWVILFLVVTFDLFGLATNDSIP